MPDPNDTKIRMIACVPGSDVLPTGSDALDARRMRMAGGGGWPGGADGRRTACAPDCMRDALESRRRTACAIDQRWCTFLPAGNFARLAHGQVCASCPRTSLRGTRFTSASLCRLLSKRPCPVSRCSEVTCCLLQLEEMVGRMPDLPCTMAN